MFEKCILTTIVFLVFAQANSAPIYYVGNDFMLHRVPEKVEEWVEKLDDLLLLKREALKGCHPLSDFMVPPSAPMPVPFPMDGMLPAPGWAYAVICAEGAGLGTVLFQKDSRGSFSHAWFEAHYSDGTKKSVSHNQDGFSKEDLGKNGPKIARVAFLFPEEAVKTAYSLAKQCASSNDYCVKRENCLNTVEVATNFLGIPLPPHTTPSHETASPEWLYQYFLNSPYYAPYAYRESKLLDAVMLAKEVFTCWALDKPFLPVPETDFSLSLGAHKQWQNPFPSSIDQSRYGGIALNKRAELKILSSNINGAIFDPLTGQLILVGQKKVHLPAMPIDDLAVAFKSIYGLGGTHPADPAVSIEPSSDTEKMEIIYFGQTYGTQFGLHLFQADHTLKELVLGSKKSKVPGYISLPRRLEIKHFDESGSTFRTWIVPETIELTESENGDAMVFNQVKMKCAAETQSNSGRVCHEQFAEHFTTHYDLFASEYPIFQEIKRMAQIAGVVKWLKENNIPIDLSYFTSYSCIPCETPLRVDQIEAPYGWNHKSRWKLSNLLGGIDLQVSLSRKVEAEANQKKAQVLSSKPDECSMSWDLPNGEVAETCAVLKTKKAGNFHLDFFDIIYPISADFTLCFSRSYDSFNDTDFGMGIGWTFTPAYLEIPKERVLAVGTGREAPRAVILKTREKDQLFSLKKFYSDGTLIYLPEDEKEHLLLYPGGSWHLVGGKVVQLFDTDGNLIELTDRKGFTTAYHYEDGTLRSISSGENSIELFYEQGRLIRVKGPGKLSVSYRYTSQGELQRAGEEMVYGYDENHRLCRFSNPEDFPIFQGSYDDFNRIKTEKWGYVESINEYSLEDQKIVRTIKIDFDALSNLLNVRERHGS